MAQNAMPAMDLDSILESELGTPDPAPAPNSEGAEPNQTEPPTPPSPGGTGDDNGQPPPAAPNGDPSNAPTPPAPESGQGGHPSGSNKRPFTRLEKAEYSATKWKKRAKKLEQERDALAAEFDRYKSLNPAMFRNPQERMDFMAWRAATAQRLKDMNADLKEYEENEAADAFDEKVQQCYSNPQSAQAYQSLETHYRDAFTFACNQVDPDGVILDYLKDSPYEPAMRNVIYKNGALQEELFRVYRNPAIGNARRQQILQRLEAQVKAFYENQAARVPPVPANQQPAAQPAGNGNPAPSAGRQPKYQLPPRQTPPAPATPAVPAAPAAPAPAPAPAPAQPPAKPQVTGALTRGNEGGALPDESAQADQLFKQLYGSV